MVKNSPSSLKNSTSNMSLRSNADVHAARQELEATKLEMAVLKKELEALSQKQNMALLEDRTVGGCTEPKNPGKQDDAHRLFDLGAQAPYNAQYPEGHFSSAYKAVVGDEPAKDGFASYASQPSGFARVSKDNTKSISALGNELARSVASQEIIPESTLFGGFEAALKRDGKIFTSVSDYALLADIERSMREITEQAKQGERDFQNNPQEDAFEKMRYSTEKLARARRWQTEVLKGAFSGLENSSQALKDMSSKLASTRLINPWALPDDRVATGAPQITISPKVEGPRVLSPESYTKPFCEFLTENPTVFHAVDYFAKKLTKAGFKKLSERKLWTDELEKGGKYFVERNGSSLIAFVVGNEYKSGNGIAMVAGHVDALTARLKPVSTKRTTAGYTQLGVAPYAGALNSTWWDRDLGIGGRVLVKDSKTGKIESKLVKLDYPIARIPTLAPHFGVGMTGQNNAETQAVPIIGLDNSDISGTADSEWKATILGGEGTFAATQPPKLVKAIAGEMGIQDYSSIVNWELELFDTQPAQVGGLEKEFIFAGRIDDKLCSWSAIEGLLAAGDSASGTINLVGVFDDEEIGSLLRQGARGNFLPSVVERISESFGTCSANLLSQTYANSFLVSADVTHAVNPNFLSNYLEGHAPRLNVGMVVSADSNGHMTTDSVSTALFTRAAEKSGAKLQVFQIRNDSRSGGTVGPMLSSAMGVRAIDVGIPQLSMHSIRATTGSLDPGLGVKMFGGFFESFEAVDAEFE